MRAVATSTRRTNGSTAGNGGSGLEATAPRTWAFIVGNCDEWDEEDRNEYGDVGLHRTLLKLGSTTAVYVPNEDCNRKRCEKLLREKVLAKSRPGDALLFYYGGHASEAAFKTSGKSWPFEDVVASLEARFAGEKVWFLLDCCYAGRLAERLPVPSRLSYLCLLCQHGDWEAGYGETWSPTECVIRVLRRYCGGEEEEADKDGNNKNNNRGGGDDDDLTVRDLCEYMADHHAAGQYQWFQASVHGRSVAVLGPTSSAVATLRGLCGSAARRITPAPSRGGVGGTRSPLWKPANEHMWKHLVGLKKGDKVYAKWLGGRPPLARGATGWPDPLPELLPVYYPAYLLESPALDDDEVRVEYRYQGLCWEGYLRPKEDWTFPGRWFDSHDYRHELSVPAHETLAKHGRYLDCSIPHGTRVWALWGKKVYPGSVAEEPSWDAVTGERMRKKRFEGFAGPFLWVEWDDEEDDDVGLLPACRCVVRAGGKPSAEWLEERAAATAVRSMTPERAVMEGMESMGKKLTTPEADLRGKCYWDGAWRPASMAASPPMESDILAQHLHFEATGEYCCVRWEGSGSHSVVPRCLFVPS